MKNFIKVVFLTSVTTAALVYVALEWRPLRSAQTVQTSEPPQAPPEVSWASTPVSAVLPVEAPKPPEALTDDEKNNIEIYQRYSPGVVNITSTTMNYDIFFRVVPSSGSGSGAILDPQGHIVTNNHVVENAQRLEVTLADKTKLPAKLVGGDPSHDIAVIQIDPGKSQLTPIPLGTSKGLQVGQKVLAIGNPFGFQRTLTTGIISSLGRSIQPEQGGPIFEDLIQTDAAINPGNSGGPLLNSAGQIIGINAAIVSPSGSSAGIGFAIPAETVRRITNDLITLGYVRRPDIGLVQTLSSSDQFRGLFQCLTASLRLNTDSGILVLAVRPNSPAERAGIRGASRQVTICGYRVPIGGDFILEFQGRPVSGLPELTAEMDRYKPGDKVKLTILRENQKQQVEVVLQEAPRN